MKNTWTKSIFSFLLLILASLSMLAQAPEGIYYQAEARKTNGAPLNNKNLTVKVTIHSGSPTGMVVWEGTHQVRTDNHGLFTIVIGEGTGGAYNFSAIPWESNSHFLNVKVISKGSTIDMGTTQFLSIPYALHAKTAAEAISFNETDPVFLSSPAYWITNGNVSNWDAAFSWGDHSAVGYLTSFAEIDPVFATHVAGTITPPDLSRWNTAYSWGDHSAAGYLTSFSETDPQVGTQVSGYVPVSNGSQLNAGSIQDHGGAIGMGTAPISETRLNVVINGPNAVGIRSEATQTYGANHGILGISSSSNGIGVKGVATFTAGARPQGVVGEALGSGGRGVYGRGGEVGVHGEGYRGITAVGSGYAGAVGISAICESSIDGIAVYGRSLSNYGGADFMAEGGGPPEYAIQSSLRWKNNITEMSGVLEKIMQLRGVNFNWDADHGGKRDFGFIGEEVVEVFPEVVAVDPEAPGYISGMDYGKMTPVLLQAIKEQQQLIEQLTARIEALENR